MTVIDTHGGGHAADKGELRNRGCTVAFSAREPKVFYSRASPLPVLLNKLMLLSFNYTSLLPFTHPPSWNFNTTNNFFQQPSADGEECC
ncbi:hypothetical protein VNO80_24065 [Phaseolus coccineus]|uniref:Uncharacterized protein n=1 Tax=Phaseolus coccineus TaxID=3886 RepID=A0AAN9LRV8_PHACN